MTDNIYDATGRMIRTWDEEKKKYKEKYGQDVDYILAQEMENDGGFQKIMRKTRKNEGGYSNRKNDLGGETNFGISSKWYPNEDKKNLSRVRADYIMYKDYYRVRGIDKLPEKTREVVFDNAIVQGQPTSVMHLQRVVGAKQDGFIGSKTLSKVEQMDEQNIIDMFREEVKKEYEAIVKKKPKQIENYPGWIKRANRY